MVAFLLLSCAVHVFSVFAQETALPSDGYATLIAADRTSNISHTVSFNHSLDESSTVGLNSFTSQPWTWTVRISDVALPNASTEISNAHVAFTTYEFTWPEKGDLNNALREELNQSRSPPGYPSCAVLIQALLPPNVTEKWDPASSDCTSMLGSDCVKNLTQALTGLPEDCIASFGLHDVGNACRDTLGANLGYGYGFLPRGFGNASMTSLNTTTTTNTTSLQKGQPYAFIVSEPYAAGNQTAFEQQARNVHILSLSGVSGLLCNAANASTSTRSADGTNHTNTAPGRLTNTGAAFGLAVFAIAGMSLL